MCVYIYIKSFLLWWWILHVHTYIHIHTLSSLSQMMKLMTIWLTLIKTAWISRGQGSPHHIIQERKQGQACPLGSTMLWPVKKKGKHRSHFIFLWKDVGRPILIQESNSASYCPAYFPFLSILKNVFKYTQCCCKYGLTATVTEVLWSLPADNLGSWHV